VWCLVSYWHQHQDDFCMRLYTSAFKLQSGVTIVIVWRSVQQVSEFTNLIRKHISGDLVGNNVRIVSEDVVQNRAVILSWEKKKILSSGLRWRVAFHLVPLHENSSAVEVKEYLKRCTLCPPTSLSPLTLLFSYPLQKNSFYYWMSDLFFFKLSHPAAWSEKCLFFSPNH